MAFPPSPDTFRRVLSRLRPEELTPCFINWTDSLRGSLAGEIVAIDGKTLRRSFDRAADKGAVHMISAWASANRLVLGQLKVGGKSNEITAIPHLLGLLALDGATVTIDAMGCQKGKCSGGLSTLLCCLINRLWARVILLSRGVSY